MDLNRMSTGHECCWGCFSSTQNDRMHACFLLLELPTDATLHTTPLSQVAEM